LFSIRHCGVIEFLILIASFTQKKNDQEGLREKGIKGLRDEGMTDDG
jgi:hypothetical protein